MITAAEDKNVTCFREVIHQEQTVTQWRLLWDHNSIGDGIEEILAL